MNYQINWWHIGLGLCLLIMGYSLAWLSTVSISNMQNFNQINLYNPLFSNDFLAIFVNNAIVGIIASIGGFLTAGFLTIAIFIIWNGFLFGIVVRGVYEFLCSQFLLGFNKYSFLFFYRPTQPSPVGRVGWDKIRERFILKCQ